MIYYSLITAKPPGRVQKSDDRYFSNRTLHFQDGRQQQEQSKKNKRLSMNLYTRSDVLKTLARRRSRANTNSAIFLQSSGAGSSVKTRKISTPDMLNKHQMLRRKSIESSEQLRLFRASITTRSKTNNINMNVGDMTEEDVSHHTQHPVNRVRKVSNILRKISIGSKVINRRSLLQSNVRVY